MIVKTEDFSVVFPEAQEVWYSIMCCINKEKGQGGVETLEEND